MSYTFGMRMLSVAAAGCLLAVFPALAHHSFAAEYDANRPVTLNGVVKKFDWVNPHSWIIIDVQEANGIATWECETGAPSILRRRGWKPSTLKPGDEVTVSGYGAKDGSHTMNARVVKTADGRQILAGSAGPGAPPGEGAPPDKPEAK